MCSDDTDMTNSRGEIGEPCGVPTWTGENVLGDPWNNKRQVLRERKEPIQDTM